MEEIYQLIIEFINTYPLMFWVGIFFLLVVFTLSIITYSKKEGKKVKDKCSGCDNSSIKPKRILFDESEHGKSNSVDISNTTQRDYFFTPQDLTQKKELINSSSTYQLPSKEKQKVEKEEFRRKIIRVNYTSSKDEHTDSFPIFRYPKFNTIVRSFRIGATKRRGYKEDEFQRSIENVFSEFFFVLGDLRINTGKDSRPFEPDIALIGKKNSSLRIDIEIDEPYDGISRQPTHCIGFDTSRDIYFLERGWIIIRFSEYQVHVFQNECLRYISNVINAVSPSFSIPGVLKAIKIVDNEKFWDVKKAQEWEKIKYRENYLNHEFKRTKEHQETIDRNLNNQEIQEEYLVTPTSFGKQYLVKNIDLNRLYSQQKDYKLDSCNDNEVNSLDSFPLTSKIKIIEGIGWGKVVLGEKKIIVDKFLLNSGILTSKYDDAYFVEYQKYGIQINYSLNDSVVAIFFYNKDKFHEHMEVFPFETNENINWDSKFIQVKDAYGIPINHFTFKGGERLVYTGIDFRFLNKRLVRIGIMKGVS